MFQTIIPRNKEHWLELRKPVITSTEVAALFGCSPYVTEYELFFRKRDNLEIEFEPTERVTWGTRLEQAIAAGVAEDNNWQIRKMDEFIVDPDLKIGASFDFAIGDDGLLEIKNVDSLKFKENWLIDGDNIEAPAAIEFQVQTQLYASKRKYTKLAALVGGNQVALVTREPDTRVFNAIEKRVAAFWESIRQNVPPAPNFARDAEFIASMYQYAEPGRVYNAGDDREMATMVSEYKALGRVVTTAQEGKDEIKAKLLMKIGEAEKVVGDTFSISAGMIGPSHVEYDRKGFRDFKIYLKKAKVTTNA